MTIYNRNKLAVAVFAVSIISIAAGYLLAGNLQSSMAASPQNERTTIAKTVWSVIQGNEKTTTTKTVETVEHSHDGLPLHKHVVTVVVAVTETTPHGTFHDFPASQPNLPIMASNTTGNATGHAAMPGIAATPGPGGASSQEPQIVIMAREYMGGTLTVPVGTKVTWVSKDSEPHTVTSDSGLFNGMLNLNGSFSFTFTEAGTYKYHCENRPEMTGTITVK
jgi:plastocyanin